MTSHVSRATRHVSRAAGVHVNEEPPPAAHQVRAKPLPAETMASARKLVGKNNAHLASELIDFEPELEPAMLHVFGAGVVCADADAARTVCEQLKIRTVSLEGDLYDPAGVITGGHRAKGSASLLCRLSELGAARAEREAAEKEVAELGAQLEAMAAAGEAAADATSELELAQHKLELHEKTMAAGELAQLAAKLDALTAAREETKANVKATKAAITEAAERKEALTAALADAEGNRDAHLAKAKKAVAEAEKKAKAAAKGLQAAQKAEGTLGAALAQLRKEMADAAAERAEAAARHGAASVEAESRAAAEAATRKEHDAIAADLKTRRAKLGAFDKEARDLSARREELDAARDERAVELKQLELRLARAAKERAAAEAVLAEMVAAHPWIAAERQKFGAAGGEYDFHKTKPAKAAEQLAKRRAGLESLSKRINKRALAMFEKTEAEYAGLLEKKETVEKDKVRTASTHTQSHARDCIRAGTHSPITCFCVAGEDRGGDRRPRAEEDRGAAEDVGQGQRRLRLHLQHAAPRHQREARAAGGMPRRGGARGEGRIRRGVEAEPYRALRRPALARRALARPLAPPIQASAGVHPRRDRRGARPLAHAEHRPDDTSALQAVAVRRRLAQGG